MNSDLRNRLQELSDEQAATLRQIEEQRLALYNERQTIQLEQLALQRRLDKIFKLEQELGDTEGDQSQMFANQQYELVVDVLNDGYQRLEVALEQAHQRQALIDQRTELLTEQPGLSDDVANYRAFEANREQLLTSLPDFYRNELLQSHRGLETRIQPLLELEQQIGGASRDVSVTLECPLYVNLDTADLSLMLPIPTDNLDSEVRQHALVSQVVDGVQKALFEMGKSPDWELVEFEDDAWSGFVTINLLAEYSGPDPVAEGCQRALAQYFDDHPSSSPVQLALQVVPIGADAWQLGRTSQAVEVVDDLNDLLDDLDEMESEELETEVVPEPEVDDTVSPVTSSSDWYSSDDVRSWRRQLKVTRGSKWTRQARQVRTLLVRMIGKGAIGENRVNRELLWKPLPAPHDEMMRASIEQLVEKQLLMADGNGHTSDGGAGGGIDTDSVSLNPQLLEEAQNLINRTVTPFWEEIVGA